MSDWKDNTGRRPRVGKDKRTRVMLRGDGEEPYEPTYGSDRDPMAKPAWAVDDTRWSFSAEGDPCRRFDVMKFKILS